MTPVRLCTLVLFSVFSAVAFPYGQDAPPPAPPPAQPSTFDCSAGECSDTNPNNEAPSQSADGGPASAPGGGAGSPGAAGAGGAERAVASDPGVSDAAAVGGVATDACSGTMTEIGDCVWNGGRSVGWEEDTQQAVDAVNSGALKADESIDFEE